MKKKSDSRKVEVKSRYMCSSQQDRKSPTSYCGILLLAVRTRTEAEQERWASAYRCGGSSCRSALPFATAKCLAAKRNTLRIVSIILPPSAVIYFVLACNQGTKADGVSLRSPRSPVIQCGRPCPTLGPMADEGGRWRGAMEGPTQVLGAPPGSVGAHEGLLL